MRFLVLTAFSIALLTNPTFAETPLPNNSGIEGVISVRPSRPGPARKDQPNIAPAPNVLFVVKSGETTVSSFTTDGEGHFSVRLAPGHYIITREDPGAAVGHWRFETDVEANQITKVQWVGDSGMR